MYGNVVCPRSHSHRLDTSVCCLSLTVGSCMTDSFPIPPWDFLRAVGWRGGEKTSQLWITITEEWKGTHWKTLLSLSTSSLSFFLHPRPISPSIPLLCYYHPDYYQAPSLWWRGGPSAHMAFGERFLTAAAQEKGSGGVGEKRRQEAQ